MTKESGTYRTLFVLSVKFLFQLRQLRIEFTAFHVPDGRSFPSVGFQRTNNPFFSWPDP